MVLKNAPQRSKKRRYSTKKIPLTYLKKTIRYFFGLYIEPFWFVLGIKKAPFVQWGWKQQLYFTVQILVVRQRGTGEAILFGYSKKYFMYRICSLLWVRKTFPRYRCGDISSRSGLQIRANWEVLSSRGTKESHQVILQRKMPHERIRAAAWGSMNFVSRVTNALSCFKKKVGSRYKREPERAVYSIMCSFV